MDWLWAVGGFALGLASSAAVLIPHHRRRLEELEDQYTRLVDSPTRTGGEFHPGKGVSRVTRAKLRHKRGSVPR